MTILWLCVSNHDCYFILQWNYSIAYIIIFLAVIKRYCCEYTNILIGQYSSTSSILKIYYIQLGYFWRYLLNWNIPCLNEHKKYLTNKVEEMTTYEIPLVSIMVVRLWSHVRIQFKKSCVVNYLYLSKEAYILSMTSRAII